MAHDTHGHHTPRRFPPTWARRPLSTAGGSRALMVAGDLLRWLLPCWPVARSARLDHVLRAWVLGLMLTFGWSRRRPGVADGAVLLGRQVGTAAAPAAGGHDPHASAGLRLLGGGALFMKAALSLGAVTPSSTRPQRLQTPADQSKPAITAIDFKRAMLNPTTFCGCRHPVLRHLGLLHLAPEYAGPQARQPTRLEPRPTGSRSSKTSAAPASWSTRSP